MDKEENVHPAVRTEILGATVLEYHAVAFRIENGAIKALRRTKPIIHQKPPVPRVSDSMNYKITSASKMAAKEGNQLQVFETPYTHARHTKLVIM